MPVPIPRALKVRRAKRYVRRLGGNENLVPLVFDSADRVDLYYATLLAMVEQESNFLNQYGHDRRRPGECPIWHCKEGRVLVTRINYQSYKAFRERTGLVQGVGPTQLTSEGFQKSAERRGGNWRPAVNIQVGAEILEGLIDDLGLFTGYGAYNGGRGNPQADYARAVMAKREAWAKRLNERIN